MKFLVIGLGSIGMRHAKNLLDMGHEVYVFDTKLPELPRMPNLKWSVSLDDKVDGWIIASPTSTHKMYLEEAINGGHHVFVEKPIANKPDGIAELLTEAKQRNLVVMVGNNLRFNSAIQEAKKYCGKPEKAIFTIRQRNTKYKESVILNWGAHEIDEALYLLGPAKVESACGTDKDAQVFLRHENGCLSEIYLDYITDPEVRYGHIFRTDGVQCRYNKIVQDSDYVDEMQAFVDRVNGKKTLGATAEDGLETLKLINRAEELAGL